MRVHKMQEAVGRTASVFYREDIGTDAHKAAAAAPCHACGSRMRSAELYGARTEHRCLTCGRTLYETVATRRPDATIYCTWEAGCERPAQTTYNRNWLCPDHLVARRNGLSAERKRGARNARRDD